MIEALVDPLVAVKTAHAAVDEVLSADLTRCSDDALLELLREQERLRRRLAAVDQRLIVETEARSLPERKAFRTTASFLRSLLRLDPAEAHARVRGADAAGPRRALTGEPLPPAYPQVAQAQAEGAISERHAGVIVKTIEALPAAVRATEAVAAEESLVGYARRFDPQQLARLAGRLADCLDPDGRLTEAADRERARDLRMWVRPDGSARGEFEATAELAELLQTHFDALAAPRPETDGVKDPRTAGQRRHDALRDALQAVLRCGGLPTTSGVTTTIVVTMTEEQYRTGRGLARTSHGALVPAAHAFEWAGGDYRLLAVLLDRVRGVTAYSSTHRLFTENQRLALHARDRGCTFPNCSAPPGWCEVHHLVDYLDGGPTSLDNGALVCPYDHRHRIAEGWSARLIDGRVGWIPPPHIDPEQAPRFNDVHDF